MVNKRKGDRLRINAHTRVSGVKVLFMAVKKREKDELNATGS